MVIAKAVAATLEWGAANKRRLLTALRMVK